MSWQADPPSKPRVGNIDGNYINDPASRPQLSCRSLLSSRCKRSAAEGSRKRRTIAPHFSMRVSQGEASSRSLKPLEHNSLPRSFRGALLASSTYKDDVELCAPRFTFFPRPRDD